MKYNIEKINQISQLLAEVVEEAIKTDGKEGVLIGDVEMAMREGLREIGQRALQCFLETVDGKAEADRDGLCVWWQTEIAKTANGYDLVGVWQSHVLPGILCRVYLRQRTCVCGSTLWNRAWQSNLRVGASDRLERHPQSL